MKIPKQTKQTIDEFYSFGDQTKLRRFGISKGKKFSLVTISKAFKTGECNDELLDLINEFYKLKTKKYGNVHG